MCTYLVMQAWDCKLNNIEADVKEVTSQFDARSCSTYGNTSSRYLIPTALKPTQVKLEAKATKSNYAHNNAMS